MHFKFVTYFAYTLIFIVLKVPSKRKYDSDYIRFGFTAIEVNNQVRPQCVICTAVLSNDALKPAKLQRHLNSVHPNLSDRPPEYFSGKLENLKKMELGKSGSRFATTERVLAASFEISRLIAKSKKPHTIGETLVKPCLLKAVEEVLGEEAKKKIEEISLSDNTVKNRIERMSQDIQDHLLIELKNYPFFALQCDESTDVAHCCQLLVFVRFLGKDNTIKEELLLSQCLETSSKGSDVMKIICDYFENNELKWENLSGFCTDGAPSMLGSRSGLASLVKQKNSSILTTQCVIHRQALANKTLPEELANTLKVAIKLVNTVKNSSLNTRVFKKLCSDLEADHAMLLFHTDVRWLSKGNMLKRLFELREELKVLLTESKYAHLFDQICQPKFEMQLAYLVDIFAHLNHLNLQLQGSGNESSRGLGNIFVFEDKLRAFLCKIDLWTHKIKTKNYSAFPTLKCFVENENYSSMTEEIFHNVIQHLQMLKYELTSYFPEYDKAETETVKKLIQNPFIVNVEDLPDEFQ